MRAWVEMERGGGEKGRWDEAASLWRRLSFQGSLQPGAGPSSGARWREGAGGRFVAEAGGVCVADAQCSKHRASSCPGRCLEQHGESRGVWRSTRRSGACGEAPPKLCTFLLSPRWALHTGNPSGKAQLRAKALGLMQASLPAPRTPCPSPAQPRGSLTDKCMAGIFPCSPRSPVPPCASRSARHLRLGWG